MCTRFLGAACALCACAALLAPGTFALAQGRSPNTHVARKALRPADPAQQADAIVWLKLHDRVALELAVAQMYDPASPRHRQWMSPKELAAFKPSVAELDTARQTLEPHGLSTVADPDGLFVRAPWAVAQLQDAFHTDIATFQRGSQVFNANVASPTLNDPAGELMLTASGSAGASPNVGVAIGWGFGGGLTVTPGWDNTTGYGTPNGTAFIDAAARERGTLIDDAQASGDLSRNSSGER